MCPQNNEDLCIKCNSTFFLIRGFSLDICCLYKVVAGAHKKGLLIHFEKINVIVTVQVASLTHMHVHTEQTQVFSLLFLKDCISFERDQVVCRQWL